MATKKRRIGSLVGAATKQSEKSEQGEGVVAPDPVVMPDYSGIEAGDKEARIPCSLIDPDPNQPRTERDPAEFAKLKATLKAAGGNHTPIRLRPHPTESGRFMIVYGEGRWLGCAELGLKVLATIGESSENSLMSVDSVFDRLFIQVVENTSHESLNIADEAIAIRNLTELHAKEKGKKLSGLQLSEILGYSTTKVSRLLKLSKASEQVLMLPRLGVTENINTLTSLMEIELLVSEFEMKSITDDLRTGEINEAAVAKKLQLLKKSQKATSADNADNQTTSVDAVATSADNADNKTTSVDAAATSADNADNQTTSVDAAATSADNADNQTTSVGTVATSEKHEKPIAQSESVKCSDAVDAFEKALTVEAINNADQKILSIEEVDFIDGKMIAYAKGVISPIVFEKDALDKIKKTIK